MNPRLEGWLSFPKSLYVCLRLLPYRQALRMPIKVRYNVKLHSLRGRIILPERQRKAMIQIGFQYVGTHDVTYRRTVLEIDGTIEFRGNAYIGSGTQLSVAKDAVLTAGNSFQVSSSGHIVCVGNMNIGERFLMGWDSLLIDTDFHPLVNVNTGISNNPQKDVVIGNNVWMAARSVVLKGGIIADGCVVGANSVVSGSFDKPNCVIAGNPAKVVKEGYRRNN